MPPFQRIKRKIKVSETGNSCLFLSLANDEQKEDDEEEAEIEGEDAGLSEHLMQRRRRERKKEGGGVNGKEGRKEDTSIK